MKNVSYTDGKPSREWQDEMTKTPTPEQLRDALENAEYEISCMADEEIYNTIQFALRFTAKALGEPSEDAGRIGVDIRNIQENQGYKDTNYIFKEMIKVIAKECAE